MKYPFLLLLSCITFYSFSQFSQLNIPATSGNFSKIKFAPDNSIWIDFPLDNYHYGKNHNYYSSSNQTNWNLVNMQTDFDVVDFAPASNNLAYLATYNNGFDTGIIYKFSSSQNLQQNTFLGGLPFLFPDFMHFYDANNGMIAMEGSSPNGNFYTTTDAGNTWNLLNSSSIPANSFNAFLSGQDNMISHHGDTSYLLPIIFDNQTCINNIYKSTNKGNNWTLLTIPTNLLSSSKANYYARMSITFKNGREGYYSIPDTNNNLILLKTLDGGLNWTKIQTNGLPNTFSDTYLNVSKTNGDLYLTDPNKFQGLWISKDNGENWTSNSSLAGQRIKCIVSHNSKIYIGENYKHKVYVADEQNVLTLNPYIVSASNTDTNEINIVMSSNMLSSSVIDTSNYIVESQKTIPLRQPNGARIDTTIWERMELESANLNPNFSNQILIKTKNNLPFDSVRITLKNALNTNNFSVIEGDPLAKITIFPKDCRGINAPLIINQPLSQTINLGQNTTFSVTDNGNGLGYQWLKDGIIIPSENSNILNLSNVALNDSGFYSVIIYGFCDSIISESAKLTVIENTTNINSNYLYKNIKIFPNPVSDKLTILFSDEIKNNIQVNLFSLDGRVVDGIKLNQNSFTNNYELNVKDLNDGVYFLNITDNVYRLNYKIIKN